MTTTRTIIVLSLVLQVAASHDAFAIQRKHRPWLMFGHSKKTSSTTRVYEDQPDPTPEPAASDTKGDRVAKQALRYEGTRYKFGEASKRAVDCSGLVTRVWEDLKMNKIPRASSALYKSGTPVHVDVLRPGDLVFFKNTYKRGISHVGV